MTSSIQPIQTLDRYLRRVARKVFDIQDGEFKRCAWMFCYLLLLIAAMMMVKPVSMALFLAEFSAQHLPFVYILTALLAALLSALYSTLLKSHSLEKLMRITLGSAICLLLTFRGFIHIEWARGIVLYLFVIWAGLITLVCASQFWLAAGLFFNVREAKRLFGPIGSGAIIGGITGGYLTKFFAPVIGSQNLVFPAVCCLGTCLLIMKRMWRFYGTDAAVQAPTAVPDSPPDLSGSGPVLSRIINSPQLRLTAAILAVSVIAARLVDYQFNAIVSAVITDQDQLASFLGFWMSNLNILSLLIQVFATRIIIQRMGVGKSLFFLPAGVLLGAAATFVHPALWPAVLIRLGEGCFKNSINKSGMELLFLTVPRSLKNQAKAFIDVFVDAAAGGIGGLVLLVSVYFLNMPPAGISLMLFCLVCVWVLLIRRIRKAYIRSFSEKLKSDSETGDESPGPIPGDTRLIGRIIDALDGSDDTQILRMLRMISGYHNKAFDPSLVRLLDHPRTEIQTAALARLYFSRKTDVSDRAQGLIRSGNIPLVTEAVRYLFHRADDPVICIQSFLADTDDRVRGAALLCLARETRKNRRLQEVFNPVKLVEKTLLGGYELADTGRAAFIKKICAAAIAGGDFHKLHPYLNLLMEDTDPGVVTAAIEAAGETRNPVFLQVLLTFLGRRAIYRQAAVTALKCHGEPLLDFLERALSNPYMSDAIRRHIPEVITGAGTQKAVDILSRQLMQPDLGIRHEIIRALNRLRISSRELSFNKSFIIPKIRREAGEYMDLLTTLYAQKRMEPKDAGSAGRAREQLIRGLEVRLDASLERVFRLLGLSYPPVEMYDAYKGIRSPDKERRLNAVEFLDNLLDMDLKRIIMPMVETGAILDSGLSQGRAVPNPDPKDSYISLLQGQDDFLKLKTLNLLAHQPDDRYIPYMAALLNSPSRVVRNMARAALKKTGRFSGLSFRPEKKF